MNMTLAANKYKEIMLQHSRAHVLQESAAGKNWYLVGKNSSLNDVAKQKKIIVNWIEITMKHWIC